MSIFKVTSGGTSSILDTQDMNSKDLATVAPNVHIQGHTAPGPTGAAKAALFTNCTVSGQVIAVLANPG